MDNGVRLLVLAVLHVLLSHLLQLVVVPLVEQLHLEMLVHVNAMLEVIVVVQSYLLALMDNLVPLLVLALALPHVLLNQLQQLVVPLFVEQ
jgi:hypothetical protein